MIHILRPHDAPTPTEPRPRILFFCRGRGRGHAVPDMLIAEELKKHGDFDLLFASYATGAATLGENGYPIVDLQLPEDAPYLEVLVRASQLIRERRPHVVISHEEFSVLPVARSLEVPVSFIVDFFLAGDNLLTQSLAHADEIVFIERRGIFPEPPAARGKTRYVGPIVRPTGVTLEHREEARRRLGVEMDATVVSVMPGAWATEQRSPLARLVLPAFASLPFPRKKLFWVAGRDAAQLTEQTRTMPDVVVLREYSPIEMLMVASDVVITKANRGTTIELAHLGVPSISLSYALNPVDELVIPRIPGNTPLDARGIDDEYLATVLESVVQQRPRRSAGAGDYAPGGAARAAAELARFIAAHADTQPKRNEASRDEAALRM